LNADPKPKDLFLFKVFEAIKLDLRLFLKLKYLIFKVKIEGNENNSRKKFQNHESKAGLRYADEI
jgi:hypothetical protein